MEGKEEYEISRGNKNKSMSNRRLEKRKQAIKDQTVDPWFTPDWAYVRKKVDDKEVNLRNFEEIWEALIFANNDWRMIPSGSVTIFSRAQRLRLDNLDEFIEEYDYFVGRAALIKFMKKQIKFHHDNEYLRLFGSEPHASVIESENVAMTTTTKEASPVSEQQDHSSNSQCSAALADEALADEETDDPKEKDTPANSVSSESRTLSSPSLPVSSTILRGRLPTLSEIALAEEKRQQEKNERRERRENSINATQRGDHEVKSFVGKAESFAGRAPLSFRVGDEVDVAIDDVYCPATIIAVTQTYVRIHYLGWEDPSYDTNIHDMGILYPPFSYVQRVKIWAGLSNRIPYWPCVAYIRPAVNNLPAGVAYLKSEKCIFVIPAMKHLPELAEWAAGRWIDTYSFQAFSKNFTRKKLLQPSLENFLETAMFELENDPHSRAVSALRFVGSYEHYTSVELWKEEKKETPKVGSKRPQPSPSALETTTNGLVFYRSKKMRRECRVVLAKAPKVPRENYATLCTSVLAMHQLNADEGGGMSVKDAFKEAVRQNLKVQSNANRDGSDHQHPHQPSQVMATYILGDVGCRLKFQY